MNRARPVNLNLMTIRFPITAIVSICHRITGFILFLFIPVGLWVLDYSLTTEGFDALHDWQGSFIKQLIIFGVLAAFLFHFVAGIRHLLMDVHVGTSLKGARITAKMVFLISIILIILAGIWLW